MRRPPCSASGTILRACRRFRLRPDAPRWQRQLAHLLQHRLRLPEVLLVLLFSLPARFYLGVVAWLVGSKVASTYGAGPLYMVSCAEDWGGVKEVVGVAAQGSQYAANRGRCRLGKTQDGWPAVMCRGLGGGHGVRRAQALLSARGVWRGPVRELPLRA